VPEAARRGGREAPPAAPLPAFLARLTTSGGVAAGVALVGTAQGVLAVAAAKAWREPPAALPAGESTRFDLASLTKPVIATLALALARRGTLPLDARVGEALPCRHPRLREVTMAQLLRHRSGLLPWTPLYARVSSRDEARTLLLSGDLLAADDAARAAYSDLGYLLWGFAAEHVLGGSLAALVAAHVTQPLAMAGVESAPGSHPDVAPTRLGNDREVELARAQGIVVRRRRTLLHGAAQDGNARFIGGLAGHAGLFGGARALWRLGCEWLAPGRVLAPADVDLALGGEAARGDRFALGWWRRRLRGHGGPALSSLAFGMVGFTGCSLWLDPASGLVAVLLAHRRDPAFDMAPWRRRFHRVAARLVEAASPGGRGDDLAAPEPTG
jgi:CubicO group peptidase (beta-lactamase class C family)